MDHHTAYEAFRAAAKRIAEDNAPVIRTVLSSGVTDVQHILMMKMALSAPLEDDKAFTFRNEAGTFGFNEILVNRLMHAAYLMGTKALDERSYRKGWEDAIEAMTKQLEAL